MGGAIIYLVIVAVWAIVLVPRWLRTHDSAPADPSTADDATRRAKADETHGRVLRRRRGSADVSVPDVPLAAPATDNSTKRSYEPDARARRTVRRRRAILGLLLLAVGVTAGVVAYGLVPWWSVGAPALLLPLYVVHTRRLLVAEHARRRRDERARRAAYARTSTAVESGIDTPSVGAYRARRVAPGMRLVDRGALFDQHAPEPWHPQEVPLPTYLTAPVAQRAYETTVSVEDYDDQTVPADEATVHDIRRAVGG
ncbi:MAG: hypothetical protein GEV10_01835 [Streptosporangiales bacterium]|nr:hypothetical protein [Streptosporangiales bacterium]